MGMLQSSASDLYPLSATAAQRPQLLHNPPNKVFEMGHMQHLHHERVFQLACPLQLLIPRPQQMLQSKTDQPGGHPPSDIKDKSGAPMPSTPLAPTSSQRRRTKREFNDRACRHCDTHFTSQWRTGPSGPSTLCNACGIRYARQIKHNQTRQTMSMDS